MENFLDSTILLGKIEKAIDDIDKLFEDLNGIEGIIENLGYDEVKRIKDSIASIHTVYDTKILTKLHKLQQFINKEYHEEVEEWMKEQKYIISSTQQLTGDMF